MSTARPPQGARTEAAGEGTPVSRPQNPATVRGACVAHRGRFRRCVHRGFTLIEVLVALTITAIALAAGAQASNALTRNAQRQSDLLLAQICAENELVKLRLATVVPPFGEMGSVCEQAGVPLGVTVSTMPTLNPAFRRVDVQVRDAQQWPLLRLSTVIGG